MKRADIASTTCIRADFELQNHAIHRDRAFICTVLDLRAIRSLKAVLPSAATLARIGEQMLS